MKKYEIDIDELIMDEFISDAKEAIKRAVFYTAEDVKGNIERFTSVDEGKLQGNWERETISDWIHNISTTTKYAKWVDRGTGIYGPTGQRIYPKNADYLTFNIGGNQVFVRSIAGQKGSNYTGRAKEETNKRLKEFMQRAVAEVAS